MWMYYSEKNKEQIPDRMIKKWIAKRFAEIIKKGGTLVSEEQAEARLNECSTCPHAGVVEPVPGLEMEGCTICTCPFATKAHMFDIFRSKDHEEHLTFEEVAEIIAKGMTGQKLEKQIITCPHPDGNKWASIDNQFKN